MPYQPETRASSLPGVQSPYGYRPTEWICILFVVLYSVTTILHIGQATRYRLWWLFPTAVLAGVTEIIGWSGRLWSSISPVLLDPYLMQITTTIIAPTPLVAANFILLGQIINILGVRYSRLSAAWYTILFLACDIIALVVQAVGGSIASTAAEQGTDPAKGGNIMLGGIVFQLVAIVAYSVLAAEFIFRYIIDKPVAGHEYADTSSRRVKTPLRMKLMLFGMALMTVLIFIRSVYRTCELADGWTGPVIQKQVLFNVCDGAMIVLAMFTLNFFHPGHLLLPAKEEILSSDHTLGVAHKTSTDDTDMTAVEKPDQS
ncbi:RTA1-like protein [Peniophora sp. CONT]|nr:RTA1-like protein [Peniophora sp. CONT]